jgi:hypothetical protein
MEVPPTQMVTPDPDIHRETATEGFRAWQVVQVLE